MTKENFSGYVLAGGKSSRMGKNKVLLEIEGETFLARAVKTVSFAAKPPVRVVFKQEQAEIIESLPENAEAIYDATNFDSPFDGLHRALQDAMSSKSKYAVVLAVDLPFVTGEIIVKLCEAIENSNKFLAVVPRQSDERPQPLCAVYNAKFCFYALQRFLNETPNNSIKDFLETISTRYINKNKLTDDPKTFANINYPEDYEKIS